MCSHWCSEMFIENPLKLAGSVREDSLSFLYLTIRRLIFSKTYITKEKQMLILGSTGEMFVTSHHLVSV